LRWGPGFFRAWVVIAALWVAGTVFAAKPSTYALLWHAPKYEVSFPSGRKVTLVERLYPPPSKDAQAWE
jgi:hypothetical protein